MWQQLDPKAKTGLTGVAIFFVGLLIAYTVGLFGNMRFSLGA